MKKLQRHTGPSKGDTAKSRSALSSSAGAKLDKQGESGERAGRKSSHRSTKHSNAIAPGNQKISTNSAPTTAISSRLQQLVDSVAADAALPSGSDRSTPGAVNASHPTVKSTTSPPLQAVKKAPQVPPVPGLTSLVSSQLQFHQATAATAKQTLNLLSQTLLQLTGANPPPALRPKPSSHNHEVITIGDSPSPVSNPPPLLSSLLPSTASVMHSYSRGNTSIQVPTISTTSQHGEKAPQDLSDERAVMRAVENSRRYRDYISKQQQVRKSFQKQIDRKISLASYPKTFRQVWPIIPVHDSTFVRNFGLESVFLRFDPNWKAAQQKLAASSRVKPICNQCGCDFASAWQIRKSNSKQLLLCESCDFTNLKILQREKLSTQLRDLVDLIRKEEVRFAEECEEARKQVVAIERQSILDKHMKFGYQTTQRPPPLLSSQTTAKDLAPVPKGSIASGTSYAPNAFTNHVKTACPNVQVVTGGGGGGLSRSGATVFESIGRAGIVPVGKGEQPRAVIPSILPMTTSHQQHGAAKFVVSASVPRAQVLSGVSSVGLGSSSSSRKRKDQSESVDEHSPPSKVFKPGSVLDQTLNKLTQQLLKRKLDEDREERMEQHHAQNGPSDDVECSEAQMTTPSPPASTPQAHKESSSRKKRRKGTPHHKRHFSSSSDH